jgi:alpha-tubulin suppressor-like RCC1 family protein
MGAEIQFFRDKNVINIEWGSHHTIALVKDLDSNKVFAFGKNDDGQLGLGSIDS